MDTTKKTGSETTLPTNDANARLFQALSDKVLDQSGIVSSQQSQIESSIQNAMSGVRASTESSNKALESQFGRELGYAQEKAQFDLTEGRASGTGGVFNMAALREFTNTTDKSLKDLAQRKEEMILQNNAQGAAKIAELEMNALEFKQKAEQQTFANLLGVANFGIQTQQEQRLAKQQTFQEESAMAQLATEYGVDVKPGDTLLSITTKVMPFASREQQLKLDKLQSEINLTNKQAAKVMQGDATSVNDKSLNALVNQTVIWDAQGKTVSDPEYGNLLQTITKAGKIDMYYDMKQKLALEKIQKEKETVTQPQQQKQKGGTPIGRFFSGQEGTQPLAPGYEYDFFGGVRKKKK